MNANKALYPIREVSSLTGVNSITLRAWERRYGLIEPVRTEGGHRLYTQEHIDIIKAAVKLTEEGVPISQVKPRINQQLAQKTETASGVDHDYQAQLIEAVESFDLEAVNQELDQIFMDISEDLMFSLLVSVNRSVASCDSTPLMVFWESQLLPRLHTRLRFSLRHLPLHACKKIWVQALTITNSRVSVLIAANVLVTKGYYPIVSMTQESNHAMLFESVSVTQCEGLCIVDDNQQFDEAEWASWVDDYPGLEFHYFTKQAEDLSIAKRIQTYAYSI
ncbi:MAG: MerR family transcriptional regulator [Pseudomonadota bacterium]|nr:MerR family transcriptional regulator [Pseudomonadota bacterium]